MEGLGFQCWCAIKEVVVLHRALEGGSHWGGGGGGGMFFTACPPNAEKLAHLLR